MDRQTLLLVDDDALLLKGLRRSLKTAGWNVVCATSVSEALTLAEHRQPDVCLVDVLMPEGGAIGFFTGLRDRGLGIPMVMMSGARSILEVAKESLRSSVQLLEKPFTSETATKVLHRAIDENESRPKNQRSLAEQIDDVLATATVSTAHIPSLDPTLAAALPLLRSSKVTIDQVCAILSNDAATSVAVIRAANSAAYAARRRIVTIDEAVVRIGQKETTEIVLSMTVKRILALKRAPFAAWSRQLWRRSVATACAARSLALFMPQSETTPGLAYTAGLLHDVGEAIALCALAQSRLALTAGDVAKPVRDYHQAMGALVFIYWGLPSPLPQMAGRHHQEAANEENEPLRQLLWAADCIADAAGYVSLGETPAAPDLEEVAVALGLSVGQLDLMTTEIQARTKIG